jgi:hypothetical protein
MKTLTHIMAVVLSAVVGFAATPAGQSVVHQYPILSGVFGVLGVLAAVYHQPQKDA